MANDDEKEFRLRPRKPARPPTRNDATAWAMAFKTVMHYARPAGRQHDQSRLAFLEEGRFRYRGISAALFASPTRGTRFAASGGRTADMSSARAPPETDQQSGSTALATESMSLVGSNHGRLRGTSACGRS